jgi:hypothetical protein
MRSYVLLPLAVSAVCALWIYLANRRPRVGGFVWPAGMEVGGGGSWPVLEYDGDVVLGCAQSFALIRCRTLRIAAGADVVARVVEAGRVIVNGRLRGVTSLTADRRLEVRGGELSVDDVRSPRVVVDRRARAVVLTLTGPCKVVRHPGADVRGFFSDLDEIAPRVAARRTRRGISLELSAARN